jgi:hypothetical protein
LLFYAWFDVKFVNLFTISGLELLQTQPVCMFIVLYSIIVRFNGKKLSIQINVANFCTAWNRFVSNLTNKFLMYKAPFCLKITLESCGKNYQDLKAVLFILGKAIKSRIPQSMSNHPHICVLTIFSGSLNQTWFLLSDMNRKFKNTNCERNLRKSVFVDFLLSNLSIKNIAFNLLCF